MRNRPRVREQRELLMQVTPGERQILTALREAEGDFKLIVENPKLWAWQVSLLIGSQSGYGQGHTLEEAWRKACKY